MATRLDSEAQIYRPTRPSAIAVGGRLWGRQCALRLRLHCAVTMCVAKAARGLKPAPHTSKLVAPEVCDSLSW
jgi:hypothetical protein